MTNRLENTDSSYLARYFLSVKEILSNPKKFYINKFSRPTSTAVKFYLLTHYLLIFITYPIVNDLLERMRLYLRLKGFLNLADLPFFDINYYLLINTSILPLLTIFFWFLASYYFKLITPKAEVPANNLAAIFLTNHAATAIPTILELIIIYLLDSLWPEGSMWMGFGFFALPVFYAAIMMILIRKALKVRHEDTAKLKVVIFINIITFLFASLLIFYLLMD